MSAQAIELEVIPVTCTGTAWIARMTGELGLTLSLESLTAHLPRHLKKAGS